MRLTILAVGRLQPALRPIADQYVERLRRDIEVAEIEVREAPSGMTIAEGRRQEAARLRERFSAGGLLIALDRTGTGWSSEQVAEHLDRWRTAARPVTLLIGGSHGLDPTLPEEADGRWSLGPITLPHQLARVVVAEQLYRASTILRREPYHK